VEYDRGLENERESRKLVHSLGLMAIGVLRSPDTRPADRLRLGAVLMASAMLLYPIADAATKYLGG